MYFCGTAVLSPSPRQQIDEESGRCPVYLLMRYLLVLSRFSFLCSATLLLSATCGMADSVLTLKQGETVVLLGDTFFERDYNHGYLETALTLATAGKQIRFRNLGWSGDTPRCESRSYFGPPAKGFARLKDQLQEIKPTTVIACYGAVDSFQGDAGAKSFVSAYRNLIKMVRETTGATVVLLSPPAIGADYARWPSLKGHEAALDQYSQLITTLAADEKLAFADLHGLMRRQQWFTVNGVTFTPEDYVRIAPLLVKSLGLDSGSGVADPPRLRSLIISKNRLFFARWRPQNEIYLFGSRKHEQGRNGAEIPQFDPLIAEMEKQIADTVSGSVK